MIMCDNKNFTQIYNSGKKIRICKKCGRKYGVNLVEIEQPEFIKHSLMNIILDYIYRLWNRIYNWLKEII